MNTSYGGYGAYGQTMSAARIPSFTITTAVPRIVQPGTGRSDAAGAVPSPTPPGTEPFPTPAGGIPTEAVFYAFPTEADKRAQRQRQPQAQLATQRAEPNPYVLGGIGLAGLLGVGLLAYGLTRRRRPRRRL